MKRLLPLFFVVVIDLLGFGIIIPLFPFMGLRLGVSASEITPILAAYSLCQLIAAPLWGALSDRFGRRPILMTSMLGASTSYLMLAFGDSMGWLIASRIVGGLMAGNISAALAYASDVTAPEERAKGLGMIGAAIGIGFMLGPAIGGLLAGGDVQTANFVLPALVAAALSIVAFLAVLLLLPESHTAEHRALHAEQRRGSSVRLLFARPALMMIVGATLLFTIAHAMLESVLAFWAFDRFGFGPRQVALLLLMMGGVLVIMQGGVVGRLTRRFGEKRVAMSGVIVYLTGLALLATVTTLPLAIVAGLCCAVGAGAYNPSASSLASRQAAPHERGVVMGTYQSATSLARVIGPAMSGPLYATISIGAPFALGILVSLPAIWLVAASQRVTASPA